MCCVNSSARRCWECRYSRRRPSRAASSPSTCSFVMGGAMSRTIWVGAVAYDPKVVTIWEGMRRYFHEEAKIPVEVVLFQSYEAQVQSLLRPPRDSGPRIDIAWNTNLAYLQADEWSNHLCQPVAMRDTDLGWTSIIVALSGGPIRN